MYFLRRTHHFYLSPFTCHLSLLPCYFLFSMNSISSTAGLWIGFAVFILFMLSLDLGLFNRRAHAIKYREAAIWSGIWITLAMVFAGIVFYYQGSVRGLEFVTGYLIELSL